MECFAEQYETAQLIRILYVEKKSLNYIANELIGLLIYFIVLNVTFINISRQPVLVVKEDRLRGENHRHWASNW